jgi:hypothetical protein
MEQRNYLGNMVPQTGYSITLIGFFLLCEKPCSIWPEKRLVPLLPHAFLLFAPTVFRKAHSAACLAAVLAEAAIRTGVLLQDPLFHRYFSIPLLLSVNSQILRGLLRVITQLTAKNSVCNADRGEEVQNAIDEIHDADGRS